jgi:hemoglobin/transferrin/lactoferrin receptor protein
MPGAPFVQRGEDPLRELLAKIAYKGRPRALGLERVESSLYVRRLDTTIKATTRDITNGATTKLTESKNFVIGPIIAGGKLFAVRPWGQTITTVGTDFYHEDRKGSEAESTTTTFNPDGSIISVKVAPRAKNVPDSSQVNVGFFMHHDWDPSPRWTLSAGGRIDWFRSKTEANPFSSPELADVYKNAKPKTEMQPTGSLGAIYRPLPSFHLTANIGKSFRVPATVESFASGKSGAGFIVPNPDLESEEGVTYEIGARLWRDGLRASLTAFHSDYRRFIERRNITFLGLPSFQSQNTGTAEVRGLEMDVAWKPAANWKLFSNASYALGTNTADPGKRALAYIPPFNGLLGVRYEAGKTGTWIETVNKWSLEKERIDGTQERKTARFSVFNLYAGKDLSELLPIFPDMRLNVGLENLFDSIYRMPATTEDVRFPSSPTNPLLEPGFSVSVGLTAKF